MIDLSLNTLGEAYIAAHDWILDLKIDIVPYLKFSTELILVFITYSRYKSKNDADDCILVLIHSMLWEWLILVLMDYLFWNLSLIDTYKGDWS